MEFVIQMPSVPQPKLSPQKHVSRGLRRAAGIENVDWNPNHDICTADAVPVAKEAERQYLYARNRRLVGRLLELERPTVTKKMGDFLASEAGVIALASHISRANCADEQEAMKASKAADLLGFNPDVIRIVHSHIVPTMRELLSALHADSRVAVFDFVRTVNSTLKSNFVGTVAAFTETNAYDLLMEYIHLPAIEDLLCTAIACKLTTMETKLLVFGHLADIEFFARLGAVMCNTNGDEKTATSCAHLICSLTVIMEKEECGNLLMRQIVQSSGLIDRCLLVMCDTDLVDTAQKRACARVLAQLVASTGRAMMDQYRSLWTQFVPLPTIVGELGSLAPIVREQLLPCVPTFCEMFVYLQHLSPPVAMTYRMNMLLLITEVCRVYTVEVLEHMPMHFWAELVNTFFALPNNNIFHQQFMRIVFMALRTNHEASLRCLLQQGKFVTRIIGLIDERPRKASRGVAMLICNGLRLNADMRQPEEYARKFLHDHFLWPAFVDQLWQETWTISQPTGKPATAATANIPQPQTIDIDLGSDYATNLGFVGDLVISPTRKQRKASKKKSRLIAKRSSSNLLVALETAGAPAGTVV
eukprot:TRINITY_DN13309_c0_g1_i1.p1 TRINITY_DN13309_c0_g1~~TRINITY_DN13309_c0_g1_i1.p1  ORF type:complete len:587 (+),score=132.91 TRINITY_DN13309_c0_g1_i1:120-1880(+)